MEWRVLNRLLEGNSKFPMKLLEIKLSNSVQLDYSLQIMNDLDRLQKELAYRPTARPNDVPREPGALMHS